MNNELLPMKNLKIIDPSLFIIVWFFIILIPCIVLKLQYR